ncbi:hypothetical protein SacxiDRAFT_2771 [Saccharomonospora xinjiangensis XJ-54]|uniref:Bacteriocin (Lactococcin_972) n=1 Tax=Saccharomonospora xinjiangensis XJ-54 TaxID=882086 RepID=I0V4D7_9PSEU|nr:hypothetical protein SacxiDRAFT_2771 [Saccharomonospora xinjiangensis XJ-54]
MRVKKLMASAVVAGALTTGVGALSVPAFAESAQAQGDVSTMACGVRAWEPTVSGGTLTGRTGRGGCTTRTTYLWSQVKRDINNWPDRVHGENYRTYVVNAYVDARGGCGPAARHYTEGWATSGGADESGHPWRC